MKTKLTYIIAAIFVTILISGYSYYTLSYPTSLFDAGHQRVQMITTAGDNFSGSWAPGVNFPLSPRYYGAYCTYTRNDTTWLFVLGGDTTGGGHATRTSYKFNFRTNQWTQIAPMPIPLRTHTAAVAGDFVYTFGGLDSPTSNGVTNIYKYDINANTWTSAGNLPIPMFLSKAIIANNSFIFVTGGVTTTLDGFEDIEIPNNLRYSTELEEVNEWKPIPNAKGDFGYIGIRTTFADNIFKAYIIGGYNVGTIPSADVIECSIDILDSANTTYTVHSNVIPGGGLARHTTALLNDGTILVSGGVRDIGFTAINSHYIFNPDNISFTQLPNSNFPICAHFSGVAFTGNQYKFMTTAGVTSGPALTNQSQVYSDSVTIGINNISTTLPETFNLKQNYPNPFNPSTKIRFDVISGADPVKLVIYDMTGREVQLLFNQTFLPGSYEYTFDASGLSGGVYFYTLQSADKIESRKMTLIK